MASHGFMRTVVLDPSVGRTHEVSTLHVARIEPCGDYQTVIHMKSGQRVICQQALWQVEEQLGLTGTHR